MTNGSVEITDGCMKRSGLDKHVSNMWDINQAGFFKPHPRVYKYVLEQLGLEPEQVSPLPGNTWVGKQLDTCPCEFIVIKTR
jgi:2-haloacid dehalogenase